MLCAMVPRCALTFECKCCCRSWWPPAEMNLVFRFIVVPILLCRGVSIVWDVFDVHGIAGVGLCLVFSWLAGIMLARFLLFITLIFWSFRTGRGGFWILCQPFDYMGNQYQMKTSVETIWEMLCCAIQNTQQTLISAQDNIKVDVFAVFSCSYPALSIGRNPYEKFLPSVKGIQSFISNSEVDEINISYLLKQT